MGDYREEFILQCLLYFSPFFYLPPSLTFRFTQQFFGAVAQLPW